MLVNIQNVHDIMSDTLNIHESTTLSFESLNRNDIQYTYEYITFHRDDMEM